MVGSKTATDFPERKRCTSAFRSRIRPRSKFRKEFQTVWMPSRLCFSETFSRQAFTVPRWRTSRPGGTYAVIGCGPVGLLAIVGARELGAEKVIAVDVVPERLALAEAFGATPVHAKEQDAREIVNEATKGRGADGVLEVVGSPDASRLAVELVRPGGVVSAVGVHTESQFAFSPGEAYDKNLTYRAGRCPARHYMERLLPLVQSRKYDLGAIVSHRLPLADGVRGYQLFEQKLESCTKVILSP